MSFVLSILIPGMLFSALPDKSIVKTFPVTNETAPILPQISVEVKPDPEEEPVYIPVLQKNGTVEQTELEYYVWGVVLGEMPASFEPEALKAQAVAARTYALRCMEDGVHPENAVCKEHSCCQSYCDPREYGGSKEYAQKVRLAVQQTRGMVVTYLQRPIFAAYFASSGGCTEDAVAVWGRSFPYLKSVESLGESDKSYQNTVVTFTAGQFQQKLGGKIEGKPSQWFGKVTYTAGGGVRTMMIGGETYTGVQLRKLLGLRSTLFTVKVKGEQIVITTNGYGHRVGMSQYGAQAMALDGCDYQEILMHYYQGVGIQKYPLSGD